MRANRYCSIIMFELLWNSEAVCSQLSGLKAELFILSGVETPLTIPGSWIL